MIFKKYNIFYILLMLLLFRALPVIAQSKVKADSIIKAGSLNIYDNPDEAISSGLSIYDDTNNSVIVRVRAMMLVSDAYSSKRDYQKALKFFLKASELSKQTTNTDLKIRILNKTAIKYQQLRVYDKAIQYLDEAEKLISASPVKDSTQMSLATNMMVRGVIYKEQLNCDIAISYFNKGIAICHKIKSISAQPILSIATYNMANCYTLMSDYGLAKANFLESIIYADSTNANSLKAFAQKGLAEVYTLEGNYSTAINVLESALGLSENVGDLILNREIYKGLSDNYLAVNQWDKYQSFHKKYVQAQLKIKESERNSISDSIEELKSIQAKKISHEKTYYTYAILVTGMLSLFSLFLVYRYQKRSRKSLRSLNNVVEKMKNEHGIAEFKK